MKIYDYAIGQIRNGARFKVLLEERTFILNGKKIIDCGKYEGELGVPEVTINAALMSIEDFYEAYKHSVPSERSERKRKRYFKALYEHELSDEDMAYGVPRDEAQMILELIVLGYILNGSLVWDEDVMGKWFWQSNKDKDLVILRQWVDNINVKNKYNEEK